MAYGLSEFQVIGPAWISSDGYDINAKGPNADSDDWYRPMLQALLTDRFKLRLHRETRLAAVYELQIAPRGLKVKPADPSGDSGTDNGRGRLTVLKSSMTRFAEVLSRQTDYPVVDRTNLAGLYDFVLEWTPDEVRESEAGSTPPPSLFTAIQEQLGLRLQSGKVPIEFLVVDSAERVPIDVKWAFSPVPRRLEAFLTAFRVTLADTFGAAVHPMKRLLGEPNGIVLRLTQ